VRNHWDTTGQIARKWRWLSHTDSGFPANRLLRSKVPGLGMIRNHYVGRTFIEPEQSIRHFGVKIKLIL
jgi:hypothetical protein